MEYPVEPAILITLRVRLDRFHPDLVFISLRCYTLGARAGPTASAEIAKEEDALDTVRTWIEEFRAIGAAD
jgi:hypothetical protein